MSHVRILSGTLLVLLGATAPAAAFALTLEFVTASEATFAEPHDVVLSPDGSRLYVADNGNDRVAVLDASTLAERGAFGHGELGSPHDVAFTPDGRLLVADTDNSRIAIYALDGERARLVDSIAARIRRPEGVVALADGRVVASGAASGNVVMFRGHEPIAEAAGFSSPHDVEVDGDGGIWVADANNDRLVRLDGDLSETRVLSGPAYAFSGPRYMDFDAAGRLYVADKYSNQIKVIAPDGSLVLVLGDRRAGAGPGLFDRPEGVEIRGADIWFADTYNNRIVRYRIAEPR